MTISLRRQAILHERQAHSHNHSLSQFHADRNKLGQHQVVATSAFNGQQDTQPTLNLNGNRPRRSSSSHQYPTKRAGLVAADLPADRINHFMAALNGSLESGPLRRPTTIRSAASKTIQEDAASLMVGLVRLILVILICVLLVKLRNNPKHYGRQKWRKHRQQVDHKGRQVGPEEEEEEESQQNRETTMISNSETNIRDNLIKNSDDKFHNNQLGLLANTDNKTSNSQQHQRRHSQPSLSNSNQSTSSKQAACERRRRHSDTTAAAALLALKLPPGPMGLPFLGYLPFLGNEIHLTLTDLSERFGPIYQIFLGGIRVVVLNDAALVRQAFKQQVFSGRPDTQLTRILQGYGIVNSEGALWKEQRAFLHSALRKLGAKSLMSGSNGLESKIQVSLEC